MKKLWKKPAVKISAAAVIVVGFALLGLWISSLRTPPPISFDFLDGRVITVRIEEDPGSTHYRSIREVYSFEADFNDLCDAADTELVAFGFGGYGSSAAFSIPSVPTMRLYRISDSASGETTLVRIKKRTVFAKSPDPPLRPENFIFRLKRSLLSPRLRPGFVTADGPTLEQGYESKDGWVTVEILYFRLRSWPPQHLLYRLKMRWRAAGRQKP